MCTVQHRTSGNKNQKRKSLFLSVSRSSANKMASRASIFNLLRRTRNLGGGAVDGVPDPVVSGISCRRFLSSGGAGNEQLVEDGPDETDDLKSRIFRVRLAKRSVTNVLQKWVGEGNQMPPASELRQISKELRNSQRYKHALEVSEWMVSSQEYEVSDKDYATRIDLMTKVFGVNAAERYFEGLPLTAKTSETYTSLLHCYAGAKLTDQAENLYERMMESDLTFTALTFNEMMTLYMAVGQVEKVSSVVADLKSRNVALDIFTYNLWISSCAAALNIDEARKVLEEMADDPASNEDWKRYRNLTSVYLTSGKLEHSDNGGLVEAEKHFTQREWITYDFLIILYASLEKKDRVDQIWKSLKMTQQKMTSRNYICILSAYLMLGHIKEVREVVSQWKLSSTPVFDHSACKRLMDAFKETGLAEVAVSLDMVMNEDDSSPK